MAFARRDFPPPMQFNDRENYLALYMDDIYKITEYCHIKFGLRYDYSNLINESAVNPRLSLWFKLTEKLRLDGFWGTCSQNPNILTTFIRNMPLDLAADPGKLKPEKAIHFTTGLNYKFDNRTHARLELYYKDLSDLLFEENRADRRAGNIGKGISKGVEFYIFKEADSESIFSGIFSYSYGFSKYKEAVYKVWLPFSFDRRHSISLMCSVSLLRNLKFNLLWRVSSGLPYSSTTGLLLTDYGGSNTFIKNETDKKYFPPYQRLDIRINYEHRSGHKLFSMYIDVTNIYNHKNVYDQLWQDDKLDEFVSDLRVVNMRTTYMLPLVPSFGVSVQF